MQQRGHCRMKRISPVAGVILIAGLMALFVPYQFIQGRPVSREKIINDGTIVAPGFGSDGIMLGEDINAVIGRFGKSRFKISKPKRVNELFAHVFKVAGPANIYFDTIYNNEEHNCAACVLKGNVVAVIGFDSSRSTVDNVIMQSGAENFIFNYGNRNLKILVSGTNKMYIYPGLGIAAIDDDTNDTIDLYLVFVPIAGTAH